jgi:hypothetical protein
MNASARRPVVLIVEDEFLLRMDAAHTIEEAGFEVLEAGSADEAIEILEARLDFCQCRADEVLHGIIHKSVHGCHPLEVISNVFLGVLLGLRQEVFYVPQFTGGVYKTFRPTKEVLGCETAASNERSLGRSSVDAADTVRRRTVKKSNPRHFRAYCRGSDDVTSFMEADKLRGKYADEVR